jgi:hypothetical protein
MLDQINKGRKKLPRRTMLYGVQGFGKTSWASEAPSPIFVQTEEGCNDLDVASFPLAKSCKDVGAALRALDSEHEYKTVVVDSLDWFERFIWQAVAQDHSKKNIEDIGYGKGYVYALTYWQGFLDLLSKLRDRGMGIILLAHTKVEKFENPETAAYDRYTPRLHKLASAMVQEWCDEVLFGTYTVSTIQANAGKDRQIGLAGERVIRTCERPAHLAKNRLGLPEELPFNKGEGYSAYAKYF